MPLPRISIRLLNTAQYTRHISSGFKNAPHHAQHAAAVFQLEITAYKVPQQIAVAPEAVEHSFQFRHGLSPLFKEFKLLGCKGLMQLVLCAGLVLTAAVGPLHVHGGVI